MITKKDFDFSHRPTLYFWVFMVIAFLLIAVYAYIYQAEPFSAFGNDLVTNILTVLAAALSAAVVTMIWCAYDASDAPRGVWSRLAIALWLWMAAEVAWAVVNMTVGEVGVGLPDVFWVLAYGLMARSLFRQYALVACPSPQKKKRIMAWMGLWYSVLALLLGVVVVNFFYGLEFVSLAVNIFYPVGDLLVMLAALWLVRKFQGGIFARPWIGFFWFAISDLLYAWLGATGLYTWSIESGNFLSGLSDILYFAAYLAVAVGAFAQWLALRYGFTVRDRLI